MNRQSILTVLLLAATYANAQAYRWVDDKGRPQFGDAPPANAKSVKKTDIKSDARTDSPAEAEQQLPFEVLQAQKDFPVTLYTAPNCKQLCEQARTALNKRGVPFTEAQVWNTETLAQLKSRTGSENVPALTVGRSVLNGFEQTNYDNLLDSAGYPKLGAAPARAQSAPAPPEGYLAPLAAEPLKPEAAAPEKPGRYDPSGLKSNRSDKPGRYDPSGLKSNRSDRPGLYRAPDDKN